MLSHGRGVDLSSVTVDRARVNRNMLQEADFGPA